MRHVTIGLLSILLLTGGVAAATPQEPTGEQPLREDFLKLVRETRGLLGKTLTSPRPFEELDTIEERIFEIPDSEFGIAQPFIGGHVKALLDMTVRLRGYMEEAEDAEEEALGSGGFPTAQYPALDWLFALRSLDEIPTVGVFAGGFSGVCNKTIAPGPNQRFTMLNEVIVAEGIRDTAGRICAAIVPYAEVACILTDVAYLLNRGFVDNQFLCSDMMYGAEVTGTYTRLGHLHEDFGITRTALVNRVDGLELRMLDKIAFNKGLIDDLDADLILHDRNMEDRTDRIIATIEALSQFLREFRAEDLRMEIEENLADSDNKPEGIFQFPASFGGHLELVSLIVGETIDRCEAAGQSVGNARMLMTRGEENYIAGEWEAAYDEFGRAYRAATR